MILQRIKDIRTDNDEKQQTIADILQISKQQYSLYERGERTFPIHLLIILAKHWNISLDYLCGLTSTPRKLYDR